MTLEQWIDRKLSPILKRLDALESSDVPIEAVASAVEEKVGQEIGILAAKVDGLARRLDKLQASGTVEIRRKPKDRKESNDKAPETIPDFSVAVPIPDAPISVSESGPAAELRDGGNQLPG